MEVDVKAKGGSLADVTMSQRKAGQWNDAEVADADPGDPAACVLRLGESGFGFAVADADAGSGRLTTAVQFADADGFAADSENHALCAGYVAGDAEFGHDAHGFAADSEDRTVCAGYVGGDAEFGHDAHGFAADSEDRAVCAGYVAGDAEFGHDAHGFAADSEDRTVCAGYVAGDSESGFAVLHVDTGHSGDDPLGIQGVAGQFVGPSEVSAIQNLEGILSHPGGVFGCVGHENYTCPDDRVGLALTGDRTCLLVLLHCLPLEVSSTPKPVLKWSALGSESH